jgi:ribosomal protein L24E
MSRCVYAVVALSLARLAFGQDAQSPTLKLVIPAAPDLLLNPSFEEPKVKGRVAAAEGGNPSKADETKTNWSHFRVLLPDKEGEGKFTIGLTNEFARTGKQSVFVDLDKVTGINRRSYLMSDLMPIKPANTYRISIWGRTDKKRPLTLDQRLMYMKVEAEFFTPDTENQSGDTENRTMLVPGNSKRIYFVSNKWSEYVTTLRTPRDAGWMKVTFRWETTREKGETDGTIYFDDASVTLVPGGESLIPLDESDVFKPEPDTETEAEKAPVPPTSANPPPPAKKP